MKNFGFLIVPTLLLAACATVVDEKRSVAVVEDGFYGGYQYEIRQRLIEGPNGTYEQTSVVYKGFSRTCILNSPNDCESAAENLIEAYEERVF